MIAPLLLAGALGLQAPPQAQEGFFAPPPIFSITFEEAMRMPKLDTPEPNPIHINWRPRARNRAADWWLGFGLQLLTGQSFQRWEQDPGAARRSGFPASFHP